MHFLKSVYMTHRAHLAPVAPSAGRPMNGFIFLYVCVEFKPQSARALICSYRPLFQFPYYVSVGPCVVGLYFQYVRIRIYVPL